MVRPVEKSKKDITLLCIPKWQTAHLGLRLQGSEFGIVGVGSKVQNSGLIGHRVDGSRLRFQVQGFGFRVSGFGFRV